MARIAEIFLGDFNRKQKETMNAASDEPYHTWMCLTCGLIYDEAAGLPEEGLPPGTRWQDVPVNWTCPDCGARKEDFEMVEF